MKSIARLVLAVWLSLGATAALAEDHVYPLENHSGLVLSVPDGWKEEIKTVRPDAECASCGRPWSARHACENEAA